MMNYILKTLRKVIIVLLIGCFSCFFVTNTYAQDGNQDIAEGVDKADENPDYDQSTWKFKDETPASAWQWLIDLAAILDVIINVLYIIIRPLLAITGLALDNSLIYGGVFHMTDMLFRFWRIMMNISFILLALLILRDIASSLRKWEDMSKIIKDKLINRFLAWALIPASRWILGAILDISTLMIYQVGWIPLTVLGSQDNLNLHILQQSSIINLVDKQSSDTDDSWGYRFSSYFSCPGHIYLPCVFENNQIKDSTWKKEIEGAKAKYGSWNNNDIARLIDEWKEYCALSPTQLIKISYDTEFTRNGNTWALATSIAWWNTQMESSACGTVKELIDGSKSMVWPLYTIYWALLNFTSINVTTSSRSTESEVVLFLIKGIAWVLLIIPLIALAFTSLARVGILWVVIAFSPFIVLYKFFWWSSKNKDNTVDSIGKNMEFKFMGMMHFKPNLEGIVELIFQPVKVVLTLWVSLIFLSAVNNMLSPQADKDGLMNAIGIELDGSDPEYQSFKVSNNGNHTTDIKIKKRSGAYATDIFFDYFSRILANIFWIMIMWKMMFIALSTKWNMTMDIVSKIKEVWEWFIKSRPIFGNMSRWSMNDSRKEIVGEFMANAKKDSTEWNAKELVNYTKSRFPGSQASIKHNKNFDFSKADTKEQKLEKFSNGISSTISSNPNYRFLNDGHTDWFSDMWYGKNITEAVKKQEFRDDLSWIKEWKAALTALWSNYIEPEKLKNAVGLKSQDQQNLQEEVFAKVNDIRGRSQATKKEGNLTTIENNTTNGKVVIYTTDLKEAYRMASKKKEMLPVIWTIESYSKKVEEWNITMINWFLANKDNPEYGKKIIEIYEINKLDKYDENKPSNKITFDWIQLIAPKKKES